MKILISSILLFFSIHCFAQRAVSPDSLQVAILERAHKSPEYKRAITDINAVKKNIALQKKGLLTGAAVVKDYNIRLGRHMGEKQTFKEVELRIDSSGDEYIHYVLLMSASRIATKEVRKTSN